MPEKPLIIRKGRSAILRYFDVSGDRLESRDTDYLRRNGLEMLGLKPNYHSSFFKAYKHPLQSNRISGEYSTRNIPILFAIIPF